MPCPGSCKRVDVRRSRPSRVAPTYHEARIACALIGGQEAEEEVLGLHAQVVHVEPRRDLMGDVAEDVVAGDEVVVDALEDRDSR